MTPRITDRLAKLEAQAVPPGTGRRLVFRVEAPSGMATPEIVGFLRARGHALHDGDEIVAINLAAGWMAPGVPIRDLTPALLTEETRAAAPSAGAWPARDRPFTFALDGPGVAR